MKPSSAGGADFRSGSASKGDIRGGKKHISKTPELRVREPPPGDGDRGDFPGVDALGAERMRENRTFFFD